MGSLCSKGSENVAVIVDTAVVCTPRMGDPEYLWRSMNINAHGGYLSREGWEEFIDADKNVYFRSEDVDTPYKLYYKRKKIT